MMRGLEEGEVGSNSGCQNNIKLVVLKKSEEGEHEVSGHCVCSRDNRGFIDVAVRSANI